MSDDDNTPDPKDAFIQRYYKKQHDKVNQDPGRRRLAKGMLLFYAILIILGCGGLGTFYLLNHSFVLGALLLVVAAFFAYYFIRAALVKPDFSKMKYDKFAKRMKWRSDIGHHPLMVKLVKFGRRRPFIAIIAFAIIISLILGLIHHSLFSYLIGGTIGLTALFGTIFFITYGVAAVMTYHHGPKDVKEFLKNDEVSPTNQWLNPSASIKGRTLGVDWTAKKPEGWKHIGFLYMLFHKTKPQEAHAQARKETQRNAAKKYKLKLRDTPRPNARKPAGKGSKAV